MSERTKPATVEEAVDALRRQLDKEYLQQRVGREFTMQIGIYSLLAAMTVYDPRLGAAFTLPFVGLSWVNEMLIRAMASERLRLLYGKSMSVSARFIWPTFWHAWLSIILLAMLLR